MPKSPQKFAGHEAEKQNFAKILDIFPFLPLRNICMIP